MISNGNEARGTVPLSSSKLRRRFLLTGLAGLAVLGPILGVSFLGDTGTSSPTITGSTASNLVYTNALPCDMLNGASTAAIELKNSSAATTLSSTGNCASASSTAATSGTFAATSWSPVTNSAGSVTSPGDLALIDASAATSNVILDTYVTNLQALGLDYSSFAFPVNIYQCAATTNNTCTSASSWTAVSNASSYITSSGGFYSASLPGGYWYDVTIDTGGEYYCISTTASGGSLAPSFFFSATVS